MATGFEAFKNAKPGDRNVGVLVDLSAFVPFAASGHLDAGGYEWEIDDLMVTAKKGGGLNTQLTCHSVGPDGYAGVPNVRTMPAPSPDEPGGGVGGNMLASIVHAIATHGIKRADGTVLTLEDLQKPDDKGRTVRAYPLTWFKNKRFFATVKDDSYTKDNGETIVTTKIDRYIGPAEYEAGKGPQKAASGSTAAPRGRVSPPQTDVPEVPVNGAAGGNAAVKQMLGIEDDGSAGAPPA